MAAVLKFNPNRPRADRSSIPAIPLTGLSGSPLVSEVVDSLRRVALIDPHALQAIFLFIDHTLLHPRLRARASDVFIDARDAE